MSGRPTEDVVPPAPGARPKPLGPLVENVTESAAACLLAMTQGNLLTLTLTHWLIASRTGLVAGTLVAAALWVFGERRRWIIAALLALATMAADYLSHPSHFGGLLGEAIVTGVAAAVLSLAAGKAWTALGRTRGAPVPRPANE